MKLGIMQPYFFPYIGYFSLISATDKWVIFDDIQYIRHGWVNRNRILHPVNGWQYIIMPLKQHARDTHICNIETLETYNWRNKIIGQLAHYKKKAPYFEETMFILSKCFEHNESNLSKFNTYYLKTICEYLEIMFDYSIFSEMELDLKEVSHPGDWALEISTRLSAAEYINPFSGKDIFDKIKFDKRNINLLFLKMKPYCYSQKRDEFIQDLSIIDIMMWNSKEEIKDMLKMYELF
jgi:hypothetical protein